ncbi:hypothetical protein M426DRAFT_138398 [Hypoxylon sp. CI-4A]|nr:hypothetical protein M426DRAFT_138398 [Hypoxylon sp. CI-4A]
MEQFSNSSTSSSDEDSQNMARNNANRGRKPAHVEFDLSAAMDQEQLTQLLSLIETIIESMQNDIVRNFETLPMQPQAQQGIAPPEVVINIIPNPRGDKTSQTFKDLPSSSQTNQSTTAGTRKNEASKLPYFVPESPEQLLKLWQKDPTTVLRESASEIMKDQLGHFMKWRAIVTKRFSDIVIKGTGTSGEVAKQGQQSPFGNAAQSNNVNAAGVPQNPSNGELSL